MSRFVELEKQFRQMNQNLGKENAKKVNVWKRNGWSGVLYGEVKRASSNVWPAEVQNL